MDGWVIYDVTYDVRCQVLSDQLTSKTEHYIKYWLINWCHRKSEINLSVYPSLSVSLTAESAVPSAVFPSADREVCQDCAAAVLQLWQRPAGVQQQDAAHCCWWVQTSRDQDMVLVSVVSDEFKPPINSQYVNVSCVQIRLVQFQESRKQLSLQFCRGNTTVFVQVLPWQPARSKFTWCPDWMQWS